MSKITVEDKAKTAKLIQSISRLNRITLNSKIELQKRWEDEAKYIGHKESKWFKFKRIVKNLFK